MAERDTEAPRVAIGGISAISTEYNAAQSRRRFQTGALLVVLAVTAGGFAVLSRTQEAHWSLPLNARVDPASTSVTILVEEQGCSSGQVPSIAKPQVELGATSVTIAVRTRERVALTQSCQSNPGTPYEVDLGEPLGDRALIDAYGGVAYNIGPIR
ncbi:MAG: hypothetical protein PGN11_08455 [Quadrisphaera sp.]